MASLLYSDTIILKDGTKIEGKILDVTPRGVNVKTAYVDIIVGQDRIQEILKEGQESQASPDGNIPPKTNFEMAEELYHEGKILDSVPLYQKILEEEPGNKDVSQRLNEIEKKLVIKMKTDNLISVNPIKPISEQEIILLAARRTAAAQAQPRQSSVASPPFPGNPLLPTSPQDRVPPTSGDNPMRLNVQGGISDPNSNNEGFAIGLPPLQAPSSLSNPPLSQSLQNDSSILQNTNAGSPFFVPRDSQSAPNPSTPFQNPANPQDSPSGNQIMPPLPPFSQIQPQSQPSQNIEAPFSDARQPSDSPNSISQPMEPQAPLMTAQSKPPMVQSSRSPFAQDDSVVKSSYEVNQSLPHLSPSAHAQSTPLPGVSTQAPFLQDQQAPPISPPTSNLSPFLQQVPLSQSDQADQSQTSLPPLLVKEETSAPSFLIVDATSQKQSTVSSPAQTPSQVFTQEPAPAPSTGIPAVEFRGVWISRFEWPERSPGICKKKILRYLDNIAANNFNAVVFQVRGQGDVLYPSPYEPWSQLIGGADPGFDPIKFALEEAHARNLEFHAYINAYPVWQGVSPPPHSNPEHPFWLYCQPDSNPNLLCVKKSGEYMKPNNSENDNYYFFSPGIPLVSAYVRKIAMDVISRYDVDGIHFDRIRYPGMDYSYDRVSLERFKGEGNPGGLSWQDWQCDQITRFLNDVYGEIASVKPRVKVSVSGWGIYNKNRYPGYTGFSSGYHQYYQDTFVWLKKGVIDAIMPMIYWDIKDPKPNYDELAKDFIANSSGRHVYCANWVSQNNMSINEFIAQINLTRQFGGPGNIAYSGEGLERRNLFALYKKDIYPQPATIPDMPWKSNPQTGIIIGKVLKKDTGEPITDARINITGREETWLSSADGFFAILNLSPGSNYQITVTKSGVGKYTSQSLPVQAGQVSKIDIPLGG